MDDIEKCDRFTDWLSDNGLLFVELLSQLEIVSMLWECLVWPGGREVWAGTARPVCRTVWRCWPRAGSGTATPPGRDGPSSRPQVSPQCGEISRLQRSSSPLPSPARVWCWTVCVSSWSTVRPYIVIWKGISVFILFIDYNRLLILNVIVVVKCNIPVKLLYNALTIDALQANCLVTLMFTISVIKQLLCCTDAGRITFPSHSFYFYFIWHFHPNHHKPTSFKTSGDMQ